MRNVMLGLMLVPVALYAGSPRAQADTVSLRLEHVDAANLARCLPDVIARAAPQLEMLQGELQDFSVVAVLPRNELLVSGPAAAVALAQKLVRALDVPRQFVWLEAMIVQTQNPAEILRLPPTSTTVEIDGNPITIAHDALGIPHPIPRDRTTLVCISSPNVTSIGQPDGLHRVVSVPRIVSLSGQKATINAGEAGTWEYEVAFVPSVLPDGSISVALRLYHEPRDARATEIELAYVARDREPWAFALLSPRREEPPNTTVFVVTVSTTELK